MNVEYASLGLGKYVNYRVAIQVYIFKIQKNVHTSCDILWKNKTEMGCIENTLSSYYKIIKRRCP